jgi:hypothetical protein
MKWPWQKAPENRATVTFLRDGRVILGMPHGATQQATHSVSMALREWVDRGLPLSVVFPFPVDVVDQRDQP